MTRTPWGKAKREVQALKKDIIALARDGVHVTEIYRHLKNRMTISERSFRRHATYIISATDITKICPSSKSMSAPIRTNPTAHSGTASPPVSSPGADKPVRLPRSTPSDLGTQKFFHDPDATDDDLW